MNLLSLICVLSCLILGLSFAKEITNVRTPRQVGIFNLLRFPNDRCEGQLGRTGTCLTRLQCHFRQGQIVGMCAQGVAVCCEITKSCGAEIKDNGTFFVNPSYPSIEHLAQQCSLSVRKQNANICQIRLDFDQFETKGPAPGTGKCDSDFFQITGQDANSVVPNVCGENKGQHMYLDVGTSNGPISLSMVSSAFNGAGVIVGRHWKIRVLQIPCNSAWRAPSSCLQYYTTSSDNIKSFNYGNIKPNQTGYPSGLQYTVCIRKEMGLCSASFKTQGPYGIGDLDTSQPQEDQSCTKDYLLIGGKKYCGGTGFPTETPQTQGTGPLQVSFVSESNRTPGNIGPSPSGFNIIYKQNGCSRLSYL